VLGLRNMVNFLKRDNGKALLTSCRSVAKHYTGNWLGAGLHETVRSVSARSRVANKLQQRSAPYTCDANLELVQIHHEKASTNLVVIDGIA